MKIRISTILAMIFFIISGLLIVSCGSDNPSNPKPGLIPQILSLIPAQARVDDTIYVAGVDLGATQSSSKLSFNGTSAITFISWCDTLIKVIVPGGATSGNITVTVGGKTSNGVLFQVLPPNYSLFFPVAKGGWGVYDRYKLDANNAHTGNVFVDSVTCVERGTYEGRTASFFITYDESTKQPIDTGYYYFDDSKLYAFTEPFTLLPASWQLIVDFNSNKWDITTIVLKDYAIAGFVVNGTMTIIGEKGTNKTFTVGDKSFDAIEVISTYKFDGTTNVFSTFLPAKFTQVVKSYYGKNCGLIYKIDGDITVEVQNMPPTVLSGAEKWERTLKSFFISIK